MSHFSTPNNLAKWTALSNQDCKLLCRAFVTTELVSWWDEESARTLGVLGVDGIKRTVDWVLFTFFTLSLLFLRIIPVDILFLSSISFSLFLFRIFSFNVYSLLQQHYEVVYLCRSFVTTELVSTKHELWRIISDRGCAGCRTGRKNGRTHTSSTPHARSCWFFIRLRADSSSCPCWFFIRVRCWFFFRVYSSSVSVLILHRREIQALWSQKKTTNRYATS